MYGKKLAYAVKIDGIREIPGADRIELANVLDYTVVVKKGEYRTGDIGIYVEVGSILPDGLPEDIKAKYDRILNGEEGANWTADERREAIESVKTFSKYPYFEFLREKKFLIKSMKLGKFGVVSQGILFKPSDLGLNDVKLGADYTAQFEITEKLEDEEEAGVSKKNRGKIFNFMMRFKWFRRIMLGRGVQCDRWDAFWPSKSDEINVQKVCSKMIEKYGYTGWIQTEKLEGQNITIFSEMEESFLHKITHGKVGKMKKRIGVCSRTRELAEGSTMGREFWKTVKLHGYDKIVKSMPGEWFIRGEHIGPGIQGNIYGLAEKDIRFFDVYQRENGKFVKFSYDKTKAVLNDFKLPMVPVLSENFTIPEPSVNEKGVEVSSCDQLLLDSDKNTIFGNNLKHKREGYVLRRRDDYTVSFKVKNPNYHI